MIHDNASDRDLTNRLFERQFEILCKREGVNPFKDDLTLLRIVFNEGYVHGLERAKFLLRYSAPETAQGNQP